jgi:hypothetical protein
MDAHVFLLYILALQLVEVSETKRHSGSQVRLFPSIRAVKNGRGGLPEINKRCKIADS